MPRNITVTFADGTSHTYQNAPDEVTPESVAERAAKEFGKPVKSLDGGRAADKAPAKPAEEHWYDTVLDEAKNLGTGAYKGLGSLFALAADAGNISPDPTEVYVRAQMGLPQREYKNDLPLSAALSASGYKPKTTGQAYRQAAAAGVGGSILGPGALPAKLAGGGLGGIGSEVGGQLTGAEFNKKTGQMEGGNLLARILGALTGGLTGSGLTQFSSTNTGRLAQEALKDVRPEDLAQAQAAQVAAHNAGLTTNIAQHMPRGSNLDAYVDTLAGNSAGAKIAKQLRDQPRQVEFLTEQQLSQLPGAIRPEATIANNVQEAASALVSKAKRLRTDEWSRVLKAAQANSPSAVPQETVANAYQALTDQIAAVPNTQKASMLAELRDKLIGPDGKTFLTDATQLNEVLKDSANSLKPVNLATKGIDAGAAKFVGAQIDQLRNDFGDAFDPIRQANQRYKQLTDEVINPMKKSVVGRLAQPAGAMDDKEAIVNRAFSVLEKGTLPGSTASEIRTMGKAFGKAGQPEVFEDLVKTWFAKGINKSLESTNLEVPETIAKKLTAYFGSPATETAKSRGLSDAIATIAENQKLPAADVAAYVKGFDVWKSQIAAAAKRPANVSGMSSGEILDDAGKTATRGIGQVSAVTPFRQPALAWSRTVRANSLKAMDNLLSSPEGVKMLITLGKTPAMSPAAQSAVTAFMATLGATTEAGPADPNSTGIIPQ